MTETARVGADGVPSEAQLLTVLVREFEPAFAEPGYVRQKPRQVGHLLPIDPSAPRPAPIPTSIDVLYRDDAVVVVDKPSGLSVHRGDDQG
ncbi:MAG: hypothetical protein JRH14_17905, partial [Deltaproteobacteria bacterium]|nr:hypothetical protein [Deltaproteobacteria bacterium]